MINLLSPTAIERIEDAARIIGQDTYNWLAVKKFLIHSFLDEDRILFSRRESGSGKHILNNYDKMVIAYWNKITGITLILDEEKKLIPKDPNKFRGWALVEYNKSKQKSKRKKNEKSKT